MKFNPFGFFAEIKPIEESLNLFETLQKNQFYYYYFQKNKLYYIFLYANKPIDLVISSLEIVKELNTKKRKIRSLRGYILHVLSYIEVDDSSVTVLTTNLQPRFWVNVKDIIKQNKKDGLLNFLFSDTDKNRASDQENLELTQQIKHLQNEIFVLKKHIQILNVTDKGTDTVILDIEAISNTKRVNSSSLSNKNFQDQPFFKLHQLDEETQKNIIKEGFKLARRDLIKLKDYYEGTSHPNTLFKLRGYSIKYDSIRKSEIYQKYSNEQYSIL
jgi:hypothetical protein